MRIKQILALILALAVGQLCCLAAEVEIVKSYYLLKYEYQDFINPLTNAGAKDSDIILFFQDVEKYLSKEAEINRENFEPKFKDALLDVAMYREHRRLSPIIFQCYGDDIEEYQNTGVIPKKFENVYAALLDALFGNGFEDKTELAVRYEEYKPLYDSGLSEYTQSTAQSFKDAMEKALSVLSKKNPDASEISDAKTLIEDAYSSLRKKPKEESSGGFGGGGGAPSVKEEATVVPPEEVTKEDTAFFTDLNENHWSYNAVKALTERKVINGFEDNTFRPEKLVTREEFAKMICTAFDLKEGTGKTVYTDALENAWYNTYLQCITDSGIMQGIGNGKFGIGNTFTRQDLAVVAYRLIDKGIVTKIYDANAEYTPFDDINSASEYAVEAISTMHKMGVINGVGNNLYSPFSGVTRAQAAQIIYSLLIK